MRYPLQPGEKEREDAALERIRATGIEIRTDEPCKPNPKDCSFCTYHAFNAEGVCLDGGRATALWSYIDEGYLNSVAYLRPVA
jgi:hypothetical protein